MLSGVHSIVGDDTLHVVRVLISIRLTGSEGGAVVLVLMAILIRRRPALLLLARSIRMLVRIIVISAASITLVPRLQVSVPTRCLGISVRRGVRGDIRGHVGRGILIVVRPSVPAVSRCVRRCGRGGGLACGVILIRVVFAFVVFVFLLLGGRVFYEGRSVLLVVLAMAFAAVVVLRAMLAVGDLLLSAVRLAGLGLDEVDECLAVDLGGEEFGFLLELLSFLEHNLRIDFASHRDLG